MVDYPETRRLDHIVWGAIVNVAPFECWLAQIRSRNRDERQYIPGELRFGWGEESSYNFFHPGLAEGRITIPSEFREQTVRHHNILIRAEYDIAVKVMDQLNQEAGLRLYLCFPRESHELFPHPELED